MASFRDKYRNPDAPPGYRDENPPKTDPLPEVYHNPDAPPGMYRFEAEPNCYKIYFPMKDFVIDLEPLIPYLDKDIADNLSDFIIQTPDEDSLSSGEIVSRNGSDIEVIDERMKDISVTSKEIIVDISPEKSKISKKTKTSSRKKHADKRIIEVESDSSGASYSHSQRKKHKKKKKKRLSRSPSSDSTSENDRKRRLKLEKDHSDDEWRRRRKERDNSEDERRRRKERYNSEDERRRRMNERDSSEDERRRRMKERDNSEDERRRRKERDNSEDERRRRKERDNSEDERRRRKERDNAEDERRRRMKERDNSEDERRRRIKQERDNSEDERKRRIKQERGTPEDRRQSVVPYQEIGSSPDEGSSSRRAKEERGSSGEDRKKPIKREYVIEEPQHLFGSYVCTVCNIKMNSEATYEAHVNGKRHLKAVNAKNVASTVLKTVPKREALDAKNVASTVSKTVPKRGEESRYPRPNPGIQRVKVKATAIIQEIVEHELKTPCPGLDQVIEIQNTDGEASYYCVLCDSPCSTNCILPHLGGFKHQLKCLKFFHRDIYDKYSYEPKYKIERTVVECLRDVQRKYGMGQITVEKEQFAPSGMQMNFRDINQPGPSYEPDVIECDETEMPDQTKAGFYCNLCQAPMNSQNMWEAHIRGKRHLANKKKAPGSAPSKLKFVPVTARAFIMDTLDRVHEPIVGLDHLRETQNHENRSEIYQCLLCCASLTHLDVVEHLVSQKHRRKYLELIRHPDLVLLENMNYRETGSLIEALCAAAETERGRGHPSVFVSRSSVKS